MVLNSAPIECFKKCLLNPEYFSLDMRPIKTVLKESGRFTPTLILMGLLHKEYQGAIPMPIIMEILSDLYSHRRTIDRSGDVGYLLEFVPPVEAVLQPQEPSLV